MVLSHAFQYLLGNVVTALFGFLSVAVYTRLLTPADYGVFVVVQSASYIASHIAFAWVKFPLFRYQSQGEHTDVRGTALIAFAGSAVALALSGAAFLFAGFDATTVTTAILFCVAINFFEMTQQVMQARLQATRLMLSSILRSALSFGIGAVVALAGGGGIGLLLSMTASYAITAGFYRASWSGVSHGVGPQTLKSFAVLGAPMAVSGVVFATAATIDRLAVAAISGAAMSGEYGASSELVRQIISMPAMSVAAAIMPMAVRLYTSDDLPTTYKHMESSCEMLLAVVGPAAVGLAIVAPVVAILVLGEQFRAAASVVIPVLSVASLISALNQGYVHASFHIAKKPQLSLLNALAILLVRVAFLYYAISEFGILGCAVVVLLSEVAGLASALFLMRYAIVLPLPFGKLSRVALAITAMAVCTSYARWLYPFDDVVGAFVLSATGMVSYTVAAWWLDVCGVRKLLDQFLARRRQRSLTTVP